MLNRLAWLLKPDVKVFIIGFNKAGTTTLHHFFQENGLRSAHYEADGKLIAAHISLNVARRHDVLRDISGYVAYSDMGLFTNDCWIEANRYFAVMHRQYPKSYFIFNDRDVEAWIRSRGLHGNLVERAQSYYGTVDRAEVEKRWRREYHARKDEIVAFFSDKPRFLIFDIEKDDPAKIVRFVAPDFALDARKFGWKKKRMTAAEEE